MSITTQTGLFDLGDFQVRSGETMRGAQLSWKTYGTLSPAKDNVILYPTSFSAQHGDTEWLVGPGKILDTDKWYVIIPDMFGNGLSTSPSNSESYPSLVTAEDNVRAQYKMLESWGIGKVACVYGWSMGAQQAYHWAALYPEVVARVVVNCGSARTAPHNQVFLHGLMALLEAAPEHQGNGRFSATPRASLRAFGRVYAGWALSQRFYRDGLHLSRFGAKNLEDFLANNWDIRFAARHASNLYAHLKGWAASDIAAALELGDDLPVALRSIRAPVLLMPGQTDLYFRVADNEAELPHLKHGKLLPIPSVWGHLAGNPAKNEEDAAFIRKAVHEWLAGGNA